MSLRLASLSALGGALACACAARPVAAQVPVPASICALQGNGFTSQFASQLVTTRGVVTANLVEAGMDGFFMQQPACDDDPATSDGLWVYTAGRAKEVPEGQLVVVTGQVAEYHGLTEITLESLQVVGPAASLPSLALLDVPAGPAAAARYLEAREGMLMAAPPLRVVGATNRYGEAYAVPWSSGITRVFRGRGEGRLLGLVFPGLRYPLWQGDGLAGVYGPLTYSYDQYKLVAWPPDAPERFRDDYPHPYWKAPRVAASGASVLTIATYNLENLFDTVDDPGKSDAAWTPTAVQYHTSIARRARSIGELLGAPDLVAVQEVEKRAVLADLVQHDALSAHDYGVLLLEGPDARGIDVGIIYKKHVLRLLDAEQRQQCSALPVADPGLACRLPDGSLGNALYSRPPLVARFQIVLTGERITLIVNHFKSKLGGAEATSPIRVAMAEHNLGLVAELTRADPGTPVVVLGDLNDDRSSPALRRLTAQGALRDLHDIVSPDDDYTYVYRGLSEVVDYILVQQAVDVTEFRPVHINVDFPSPAKGLDDMRTPRTSDHDPLLMHITLPGTIPGRAYLPLAASAWAPSGS